jgi:hypothetical protein
MTTTDTSLTMPATAGAASRYQQLRSHLAETARRGRSPAHRAG